MNLSVVIVNYNVCYFLEQCLYTLLKAAEGIETEVFVVDNASTDDSRSYLPQRFPGVRFIWNEDNAGFGKANNQALSLTKGDYILLLNPDTLLPETVLQDCLAFFGRHAGAGAVGMRMFDGSGKYLPESKRGLPGIATAFYKLSGLIRLFPTHPVIARYYLGHLSPEKVQEIDVLAGAFMMIPRKVYETTGGFDEQFFMYGEDIDLSYRIRQAGFTNYYLPEPGIIHFKGESTTKDLVYTRYFYEAMQLFVRKHHKGQSFYWKWVLEAAIVARGALSAMRRLVPRKPVVENKLRHWQITGDAGAAAELRELTGANEAFTGSHAWENGVTDTVYALGDTYGMHAVLESWKKMPPTGRVWFHGKGTAAIIGSSDRKSNGEVIVLKKEVAV